MFANFKRLLTPGYLIILSCYVYALVELPMVWTHGDGWGSAIFTILSLPIASLLIGLLLLLHSSNAHHGNLARGVSLVVVPFIGQSEVVSLLQWFFRDNLPNTSSLTVLLRFFSMLGLFIICSIECMYFFNQRKTTTEPPH
jgi:hypothetical protein